MQTATQTRSARKSKPKPTAKARAKEPENIQDRKHAVESRMAQLAEANGGTLTPEVVVRDAQDPKSPLHGEFEWDKNKAAWNHWIEHARKLIKTVKYQVRTEERVYSVPLYVRSPDAEDNQQGYAPVTSYAGQGDTMRRFLLRELRRVIEYAKRARSYAIDAEDREIEKALNDFISRASPMIEE